MKLYEFSGAPSPRRVRIFLKEKGLSMSSVQIDLPTGEQFSSEFRAVNDRCMVPALETSDAGTICEVFAIWSYIEDLHPAPNLLGQSRRERAQVIMWDRRMEQEGYAAAAEAFRNAVPAFAGRALTGPREFEQTPALVERGTRRVLHFYEDLDARLRESPHVAGDAFTAADITALVTVDFAVQDVGIPIPEACDALTTWRETVSRRASMADSRK